MERRPSRRPLRHHAQRHFHSQAFSFTQAPKKRSGLRRMAWPAGRTALPAALARARSENLAYFFPSNIPASSTAIRCPASTILRPEISYAACANSGVSLGASVFSGCGPGGYALWQPMR